jgi:hypothetical protein
VQGADVDVETALSVVLPTGDTARFLGKGGLGLQLTVPVTWRLSSKLETRLNAGVLYTRGMSEILGTRRDTLGYTLGGRVLYHATKDVDLMVEALYVRDPQVENCGTTWTQDTFLISPGIRFALNAKNGSRVVPGIAFPIGIGPSRGQAGVFLYLTVER